MNLIPDDYKTYLEQLRLLHIAGFSMSVFIVLSLMVTIGLKYSAAEYQREVTILEKQKAISSHQRGILQDLEKNRKQLVSKREILEKLRGGASAEDMFVNIDRSLTGRNVWFKDWSFVRAGSKTEKKAKGVNTGYFIVIPEDERTNKTKEEAWRIQMHMEISGQATDHEALSSFVRRVLQRPQIADVKILNTKKQGSGDSTVVDFRLIMMINSGYTNS